METEIEEDIKEIECFFNKNFFVNGSWASIHRNEIANLEESIENLLKAYKELKEEIQNTKKEYQSLINKIETKIDYFDYEFEKAKRKNDNDRADYYWDLIINLKKILEEE